MSDQLEWDFFISHASEDKNELVRPLAETLKALGFKVWYDEFSLKIGDSLNQSINKGLANSEFGIVILSPYFFAKNWPKHELDGLVALEMASGEAKILPIWHNLSHQDVTKYSPILADKKAISSTEGIENIVRELIRAVEMSLGLPENLPTPPHDLIFFTDVVAAFKEISEFKNREFVDEEISNIYQMLWIYGINTRQKIHEFVSSVSVFDTLRKLYKEEMLRPEESSFEPQEVANTGGYLFTQNCSKESIELVREGLQDTDEYIKKHPGAKHRTITLHLPRILDGRQLVSLISQAHALHTDYDEPENETEAELISSFFELIVDLDVLVEESTSGASVNITFDISHKIQQLEKHGLFVYGTLKKAKWKSDFQDKAIELDMITAYIMVRKTEKSAVYGIIRLGRQ